MPEVSRFYGIVIRIYYEDHAPPHVHAEYSRSEGRFDMTSGRMLSGSLPTRVERLVREWSELHRAEHIEDWSLASRRQPLDRIAPLD